MTQSESTTAVFNIRVSDPKQASVRGDDLNSQERTCRDYAERKGYVVTEVYHDSMTGSHADRPGVQAMLTYLRKHRGTVIVVDHAYRLGRDLFGYLQIRVEIGKAGGLLESPVIEFKDNSSSRLVENVVRAFRNISANTMPNRQPAVWKPVCKMAIGFPVTGRL